MSATILPAMHQISLTDTELKDLAQLAYLGNQVANGRVAPKADKPYPELHAALQKVYETALEAEMQDLRIVQDSRGDLSCMQHESIGLDPEAKRTHDIIDDYDEQAAFEIAAEELADRDTHDYSHTPAGRRATQNEMQDRDHRAYHRYMHEFEVHGFERLVIDRSRRAMPCQNNDAQQTKPKTA